MDQIVEKLNTERRKALAETFAFLDRFISFRDRRVYEIGADRFFVSALEIIRLGAASVECTNVSPLKTELIHEHPSIRFHLIDSSSSPFSPGSFDTVYGRAVLEHIHQPDQVAREAARLLSPGGMIYLDGAPMWTCRHGHHVWVDAPSGRRYQFAAQHPFEPWEHLQYAPDTMRHRLVVRGIPADDADLIIQHVYFSDDICRHSPTKIIAAFQQIDNLEVVPVRIAVGAEPPVISEFAPIDLRTGKLILLGRKLGSDHRRGDFERYVHAGLHLIEGQRFITNEVPPEFRLPRVT